MDKKIAFGRTFDYYGTVVNADINIPDGIVRYLK